MQLAATRFGCCVPLFPLKNITIRSPTVLSASFCSGILPGRILGRIVLTNLSPDSKQTREGTNANTNPDNPTIKYEVVAESPGGFQKRRLLGSVTRRVDGRSGKD